ncbi:M20 family metallopeptidase [Phytohabitans rumicis]|uniref:Peptidase M20 n=1 Tax=Phytohabitans rumicis TaxID=1076125 RepID=A0A6V8LCA7_9ACTN|nr:M20 family metallopeptidase [Phytohabitans rumicis]GFJ92628.1 peptidase M20 [Phytohabitans rumicis]
MDHLLSAADELLTIASTADRPGELRRAIDYVLDFVGPGFTVERFESNGVPSALVYCGNPRPEFAVILNAHLDVVPGSPDQFHPRRDGDRLYARGAQDMKVSALALAQAFRDTAAALPYPIALQLVADEEVGGRNGTLHQLQSGVTGRFVIIGEHSRLDIVADSKGLVHANLRASGRGGHGAYPWLGDNALLKLVRTVTRLQDAYPPPAEEAWRTTVNLARIETPNRAYNQIPADAEAWLDIRFPPEDATFAGATADGMAAYLGGFCEPGVTVTINHVDGPHHADHDRPEIAHLRRAAQDQGFASDFLYKHGAGDGRFYSARGIAAVAFGVGGHGQHGPEEYAEIPTIDPYYRALRQFLEHLPATVTSTR